MQHREIGIWKVQWEVKRPGGPEKISNQNLSRISEREKKQRS